MRALAAYIMRGRWPAITATTGLGVATLLLPPLTSPLGYLSAAAVALVTLVQGPKEGLLNTAAATLAVATMGLVVGHPVVAVMFAIMLWLPAWLMAVVLGMSRSLAITLLASGAVCAMLLSGIYLMVPDPAASWYNWITTEIMPGLEKAGVALPPMTELEPSLREYSRILTGWLLASVNFGWIVSLLIARWWQSVLYKPAAFGEEFRQLKLGMGAAGVGAALAILSLLLDGQLKQWSTNLLFIGVVLFLMQGLAIGHAIVKKTRANTAWLVAMYVVIIMSPAGMVAAAALGLLDNGINFRARIRPAED